MSLLLGPGLLVSAAAAALALGFLKVFYFLNGFEAVVTYLGLSNSSSLLEMH